MKRLFLGAICGLPLLLWAERGFAASPPVTFTKDIAPIVYEHCATCHHTGEATPFNLISYSEVSKRGRQIVDVIGSGLMPPWPPQIGHGYPALVGARQLTAGQIELMQRWVSGGELEGAAADLPPVPQWSGEWQLGQPDLVVEMPRAFALPADGKDLYRNFVIPSPVQERRYVRALEFRPEGRAAHHVFIKTDHSRQSRLKDGAQGEAGFPGMIAENATMPPGQFLTWQPGKKASISPPGMPWVLEPGTDLVLESHLRPTGKIEPVRFKVGLYFTNTPPERTAFRLILNSLMIDIPAGAMNYAVESSFKLPVDCRALAVLPHCHLLGRQVEGHAELPDGSALPLILITNWDFNWQGDYRFEQAVALPKDAILRMRITYDNSTNNARNPNNPPKRVRYGAESTDEMAELSFLLLPDHPGDEAALNAAYQSNTLQMMVRYDEQQAAEKPDDANARLKLGIIRLAQHRVPEAQVEIQRAVELGPALAQAHYYSGLIARLQNRLRDAEREFETSSALDPLDAKTWGNIGLVRAQLEDYDGAKKAFQRALEINPTDKISRSMMEVLNRPAQKRQ